MNSGLFAGYCFAYFIEVDEIIFTYIGYSCPVMVTVEYDVRCFEMLQYVAAR